MGVPALAAVATFCLIFTVVAVPYYLFVLRSENADRATLRQRLRGRGVSIVATGAGALLKDAERLSAIGPLHGLLAGGNAVAAAIRRLVAQSGLPVTAGQVVLGSACMMLLTDIVVTARTGVWWMGLVASALVGLVPVAVLRWRRAQRLNKFEEHFPEAIDMIARTLRAGHAFTTGLRLAADELPDPVASEFKLLHDQQNYGMPITESLRGFAQRVPIIDARFFVTAVLTQREAGGNLAEVLDNLAAVIRERFRIKRQLQVLTARGRMTGWILAAMPPFLGVFFMIGMPEHFGVLFEEPLGVQMVIVAVVLQLVGALMIHKITAVEY